MSGQYHKSYDEEDPFDDYSKETEVGVGVSDKIILIVSAVGFGVMTLMAYCFIVSRTKSADELGNEAGNVDYEEELLKSDVANLNRAQRRARAKALMKRQRRAPIPDVNQPMDDGGNNDDNDDGDENQNLLLLENDEHNNNNNNNNNTHLSRKERNIAAKATERKARHLLDGKRQLEQKQAMQIAKEEKQKRLKLEEEKARNDKIRLKEKQEEKSQHDFEQWNIFLTTPNGKTKLTVEEWVEEVKVGHSVVPLGDLALRFNGSVHYVSKRIKQLVQAGRIAGIVDDEQSTFIPLSHEQLLSLASFVKQKGEVSLQDLSRAVMDLL